MDLKETYDKIAEDWHRDHQKDDWWVAGAEKFASFVPTGGRVLDAGCGGGTKAKYLAGKGFEVFGIDFSQNMVDIARREVPGAEFSTMDINDVDKLEGEFDGIFAQAVLLHIPRRDALKVVEKMAGKIKNGGYLYVTVKEKKPGRDDEEIKTEDDYGYPYERFFSYFTLEEIGGFVEGAGLEVAYSDIAATGKTRWIHVIGKKKT